MIEKTNVQGYNQYMKERVYKTLYGAIVADALGVPVEFRDRESLRQNPVTDMTGYGTYNLPKGSWSDDSSMMLCLADSIAKKGSIDYDDIMNNFLNWFKHAEYSPDNKVFDIGRTCLRAISHYEQGIEALKCGPNEEKDNGNGSLMRIAPLPLYLFHAYPDKTMEQEAAYEIIHNVSSLTHGHAISLIACDIYCTLMIEILRGRKKEDLQDCVFPEIEKFVRKHAEYKSALEKIDRLFQPSFKDTPEAGIKSSGYVVDTLEAALWCFLNTNTYRDCVLKAVNLGRDTDTVACVAGSIAGLYHGDIPTDWISSIRNKQLVDKIIESFAELLIQKSKSHPSVC